MFDSFKTTLVAAVVAIAPLCGATATLADEQKLILFGDHDYGQSVEEFMNSVDQGIAGLMASMQAGKRCTQAVIRGEHNDVFSLRLDCTGGHSSSAQYAETPQELRDALEATLIRSDTQCRTREFGSTLIGPLDGELQLQEMQLLITCQTS